MQNTNKHRGIGEFELESPCEECEHQAWLIMHAAQQFAERIPDIMNNELSGGERINCLLNVLGMLTVTVETCAHACLLIAGRIRLDR